MNFGKTHLQILHFPIALTLAAALADVCWAIWRQHFFRHAGFYCLLFAAVMVIPTVLAGDNLMDQGSQSPGAIGEVHQNLGFTTLGVLLAATLVRSVGRNKLRGWMLWAYVLLMAASAVLIVLTAHWGGMFAFGKDYLGDMF